MAAHDVIRRRAVAFTVTRPTLVSMSYGIATREGAVVAGVTGHMQPMSDKELRFMPEGLNTQEVWNIWSQNQLIEGDQVSDGSSPVVTVVRSKYWKEGNFYHAQAVVVTDENQLTVVINAIGAAITPEPVGAGVGAHP